MSRRIIQIMALLNVLAVATLFIGFRALPTPSRLDESISRTMQEPFEGVGPSEFGKMNQMVFRYEYALKDRDAWKARSTQYRYMATAAGLILALNTGVFVLAMAAQSKASNLSNPQASVPTQTGPPAA